MSATRSAPPDPRRGLHPVDVVLGVFCLAMLALMWPLPGQETIPYHLLFVSLTLVYGFRGWPPESRGSSLAW